MSSPPDNQRPDIQADQTSQGVRVRHPLRGVRRPAPVIVGVSAGAALAAAILACLGGSQALLFDNLQELAATTGGALGLLVASRGLPGRNRWLVVALAISLAGSTCGMLAWDLSHGTGTVLAQLGDLLFAASVGVGVAAILPAIFDTLGVGSLAGIALDGLILFLAGVTLVAGVWSTADAAPRDAAASLGTVLLVSVTAACVLALVARRVAPSPGGPWATFSGAALLGVAWLMWSGDPTASATVGPSDFLFSGGVLLIAYGGVTWDTAASADPRFGRAAGIAVAGLPVVAVLISLGVVALAHGQAFLGDLVGVAAAAVILASTARQVYLYLLQVRASARERAMVERLERLERQHGRLAAALQQAPVMVLLTDQAGVIEYANPAFERLTGASPSSVIGRTVADALAGHRRVDAFHAGLRDTVLSGAVGSFTSEGRGADGALLAADVTVGPVVDDAGAVIGRVVLGRDRSRERQMEADLALEAKVQVALAGAVQRVPAAASAEQAAQAVCDALGMLPSVSFVAVLGFTALDGVVALARQAPPGFETRPSRSSGRITETRRRLASGAYAEFWRPAPDDGAWGVALTDLGAKAVAFWPILHGDHATGALMLVTCDASFAPTLVERMPAVTDVTNTLSALLGAQLQQRRERADTHVALQRVIDDEAFAPVYQPLVDLASREVVGYEALTRFTSGQRPDRCFADAWSVGLGEALELATLEAAILQARALPAGRWIDLNVSPALLANAARLRELLHRAERPVFLEITEHEAIDDYAAVRSSIASLGLDIRLAVDDAGAGIANFGHIIELKPDLVKLDMSLVRHVNVDVGRQALVIAMRHFARTAGCRLVAEGIETEEEAATLLALGVELGQGYLLGRPGPAETWLPTSDAPVTGSRRTARPTGAPIVSGSRAASVS